MDSSEEEDADGVREDREEEEEEDREGSHSPDESGQVDIKQRLTFKADMYNLQEDEHPRSKLPRK